MASLCNDLNLVRACSKTGQPAQAMVLPVSAGPRISDPILIADDDPSSRALARHILSRAGFEVILAADGNEALSALKHQTAGLILLDVEMPLKGGFETCRELKSDPRYAEIPVIFLTAEGTPQAKALGFSAGGADYVTKPIEPVELLARIRCHLELAAHRQELNRKVRLYKDVASEQMSRLEQVRQGQTSLLTNPASLSDQAVAVRLLTANEVGGDFYEISRLSASQLAFLVADVSGHDLTIPFVTGALKALAGFGLRECLTPSETMAIFNAGLLKILSADRYVTACYAKVNEGGKELEIINAGHPPALIQRRQGPSEYLHAVGDVLGMYEQVRFDEVSIPLEPGDRLFLYTDGLIEGYLDDQSRRGRQAYGMERFKADVEGLRSCSLVEVVDTIVQMLVAEGEGNVGDDVVLLGVEFQPDHEQA